MKINNLKNTYDMMFESTDIIVPLFIVVNPNDKWMDSRKDGLIDWQWVIGILHSGLGTGFGVRSGL